MVSLDGNEVAVLLNTLYQRMKTVDDWEFSTLIGLERHEVEAMWEQLNSVYPDVAGAVIDDPPPR